MILPILAALLLGVAAGIVTGLIPGIHINLVALLLFASSAFFLQFTTPIMLAIFVVSMSITHTFVDFLPSIFLGAPDDDTALSVLPGHRLLLKGDGYGAVKLTVIGSFFGLLIAIALSFLFIVGIPLIYPFLIKSIGFLLIAIAGFLIFKENKKFFAFFIFVLSGILGVLTLNFTLIQQPLFPLLTGLFGTSLLTMSFIRKVKVPEQKIKPVKVEKKETIKALGASIFSSSLVSFLPGVGAAQAAVISTSFGKISEKGFLILLGAINTIVMVLSFVALYVIEKPRTGSAVIVGKFLSVFTIQNLFLFLAVALVVGSIAVFVTLFMAKVFTRSIMKVNYQKLSLSIIIFLFTLTIILSGPFALLVLATATAIGLLTAIFGIRKMHMMGCLLVPVILLYLPF